LIAAALAWRRRRTHRTRTPFAVIAFAAIAAASGGCGDGSDGGAGARAPTDWSKLPAATNADVELAPLGGRQDAYDRICARGRGDSFAKALCGGGGRPEIRDMAELLDLVGLADQRAFALTGNSTSLVAMSVSAINPRVLVFPRVGADLRRPDAMTAVGFVRGEPFVELASRDPLTGDFNFYLLSFEQRCSYDSGGCDLASQLTAEIERNWTAYSVYDQDDLESTSFDCKSCHQPAGAGSKRILRMQELTSPWMHWFPQRFVQRTDSDRALAAQFIEAHQDDGQYGGIPVDVIAGALDEGSGAQLEALVRAEGFADQPNPFDAQIATEMESGSSPTWQARFQKHLTGEAIAVPYPRIDVTDEMKRTAAVRSYRDVVRGIAPRGSLIDVRQVFSDDAAEKLSFVPQPGADGKTVLLQMCGRCHDGRGNPQLNKNHFNVRKLEEMPRAEKDLAVTRMNETGATRMPPWRIGSLSADAIRAATSELQN
jgi:mono/diheme cytochrome c family protein